MIKELSLPLQTGILQTNTIFLPQAINSPIIPSGYYHDQVGQLYYYDAYNDKVYYVMGGYFYPLAWEYRKWTGAYLGSLNVGDTIRVTAIFKYVGPQRSRNIRLSLFRYEKGTIPSGDMSEVAGSNVTVTLTFGPFSTPQNVITQRDIKIGSEASGRDLGVYAKFTDVLTGFIYEVNCTYGFYGIASVLAVAGEFSEFTISNVQKV